MLDRSIPSGRVQDNHRQGGLSTMISGARRFLDRAQFVIGTEHRLAQLLSSMWSLNRRSELITVTAEERRSSSSLMCQNSRTGDLNPLSWRIGNTAPSFLGFRNLLLATRWPSAGLRFAVTDDAGDDQFRIIEHSAERRRQA